MKNPNVDNVGETLLRKFAGATSRRGLLARVGAALVAAPVLPLLPVDRANAGKPDRSAEAKTSFALSAQTRDDRKCDYWRYCSIDGTLCTCCGGGINSCPAGAEPSPLSWVGSCINPDEGKAYLIAYRDCCGKPVCQTCRCSSADRMTQIYVPQLNGEILWCFGTSSQEYHCTISSVASTAN